MLGPGRYRYALVAIIFIVFLYIFQDSTPAAQTFVQNLRPGPTKLFKVTSPWTNIPVRHPVDPLIRIPSARPRKLPQVQHRFQAKHESPEDKRIRLTRRDAVKEAFVRGWKSYRQKAWLADELRPISGSAITTFGGWAATLVDSLDTLWIMGLRTEFDEAVNAALKIEFDNIQMEEINLFETTIRYLGGFISAYDLSGDKRCLRKATELGEMLLVGFDTPNRMPITRWNVNLAKEGAPQEADSTILLAEIGSLVMEFTRLALVTRDDRFYDAVDRITRHLQEQQMDTAIPGLWPLVVDAKNLNFTTGTHYSLAAMADSTFEYLAKMHALTGGSDTRYIDMYNKSMTAAINHLLFRPMMPGWKDDTLVCGSAQIDDQGNITLLRNQQHLTCYAGGMFALGGRLGGFENHVEVGSMLMQGCINSYDAFPLGIMAESFYFSACPGGTGRPCKFDEAQWRHDVLADHSDNDAGEETIISEEHLPRGISKVVDRRYSLRPEAIESVFILYRITGRKELLESAWRMWTSIDKATKTPLANSAIADVTIASGYATKEDRMESFWMAETLKYFYLIFSEPDLIDLDEYVFNTEAHPFKRLL